MKKLYILSLIMMWCWGLAFADLNIDKQMSQIGKDLQNFVAADARASSEKEAYDLAMAQLKEKLTDFLAGEGIKNADISTCLGKARTLTSQISASRVRVMLYIPVADIKGDDNASSGKTTVAPVQNIVTLNRPVIVTEEQSPAVAHRNIPKVVEELAVLSSGNAVMEKLVALKKASGIKNAAVFPIANIHDFYVVVIDKTDKVKAVLHSVMGEWSNALTGEAVDIYSYKDNTAYWFTL